jgi:GT2 family glycosyltransferase
MEALVVVPTLGQRPDLLRRTLASITGQQPHAPRTIVVVAGDDGPAREAAGAVDVEVVTQRSAGLSAAINEGWLLAGDSADAWSWLGDDDELLPGSLARTCAALQTRPGSSMVYGRCRYVDGAGRTLWTARPGRLAALLAPAGPNLIPQPGSLLRADSVRRVGMLDPELRYAMDLDLFLRLRTVGALTYLPSELAAFRWHADSTTVANQSASAAELRAVQDRYGQGRRARLARPLAGVVGRAAYHADRLLARLGSAGSS